MLARSIHLLFGVIGGVSNDTKEGATGNTICKFADNAISVHFNEIVVHHQQPDSVNKLALAVRKDSSRCRRSELISVPVLKSETELQKCITVSPDNLLEKCYALLEYTQYGVQKMKTVWPGHTSKDSQKIDILAKAKPFQRMRVESNRTIA
jgi:hypothetical protein